MNPTSSFPGRSRNFATRAALYAALAASALLSGCVVAERPARRVYVEAPPPPPPPPGFVASVEVVPLPPPPRREVVVYSTRPSPRHVWVEGYWAYRDHRHVWVGGHWDLPPREHAVWVAPRYERRPGGSIFIEGYWR